MKTSQLILILFSVTLLLPSCVDREIRVSRDLEGNWNMTSYTVDGEQQIPSEFESVTMNYEDNEDGTGTALFTYTLPGTPMEPGLSIFESYTYEVTEGEGKLDQLLLSRDGQTIIAEIELDDDFLDMEWVHMNQTIKIIANRR
jgi:hypothetical protein